MEEKEPRCLDMTNALHVCVWKCHLWVSLISTIYVSIKTLMKKKPREARYKQEGPHINSVITSRSQVQYTASLWILRTGFESRTCKRSTGGRRMVGLHHKLISSQCLPRELQIHEFITAWISTALSKAFTSPQGLPPPSTLQGRNFLLCHILVNIPAHNQYAG